MATITLRDGLVVLVDDEDHERVSPYRWHAHPTKASSGRIYVQRGRLLDDGDGPQTIYLHRVILDAPDGSYVDHMNGDGLDNRKSNLRLCSMSQNIAWGVFPPSQSGFRGVSYQRDKKRYRARLCVGRKNILLGLFRSAEDAARAYDCAAIRIFGDFARTNFAPEAYS